MSTATTPKTLDESAIDLERAKRNAKRIVDAEERPAHEPLRALTLRELYDRPSPDYLIDQLIPQGALGELIGDSETLKSFIAIHIGMVVSLSNQTQFFGLSVVNHGPVLYIAAEGAGAFQYRVRAWCTAHQVAVDEAPFRVITAPLNLRDPDFQRELESIVDEVAPVLIFVDTLHRAIPGAEENSSRDVGEVVGFATRIQARCGAAVFFLHHPPKSDPSGRGRGSGALYYAADTELSSVLEGEENADGTKVITLSVRKQKDDAKVSLMLTNRIVEVLNEQGRPMAHASGRAITSCILELASDADLQAQAGGLAREVLAFLTAHPGSVLSEIREGVRKGKGKVREVIEELEREHRIVKSAVKRGRTWRDEYAAAAVPTEATLMVEPCDF